MCVFKCPDIENNLTCRDMKWYYHCGKQFDNFLKSWTYKYSNPTRSFSQKWKLKTYPLMFILALHLITKGRKQLTRSSTGKWLNKPWCICIVECRAATERNKPLIAQQHGLTSGAWCAEPKKPVSEASQWSLWGGSILHMSLFGNRANYRRKEQMVVPLRGGNPRGRRKYF